MPAPTHRCYFRAHYIKPLACNILCFVDIASVHKTLIGLVDKLGPEGVACWASKLRNLGCVAK